MWLNRKRVSDKPAQDRERVINYKKFFGVPEGKDIIFDLMNKYHVLNPILPTDPIQAARMEGQRQVVLYMLTQANMDMVQFDKMLKGEFDHG